MRNSSGGEFYWRWRADSDLRHMRGIVAGSRIGEDKNDYPTPMAACDAANRWVNQYEATMKDKSVDVLVMEEVKRVFDLPECPPSDQMINQIKFVRANLRIGLKDAKDLCEAKRDNRVEQHMKEYLAKESFVY